MFPIYRFWYKQQVCCRITSADERITCEKAVFMENCSLEQYNITYNMDNKLFLIKIPLLMSTVDAESNIDAQRGPQM